MAISFNTLHRGLRINLGDVPDEGGTTTIPKEFALVSLIVGAVIVFSKRDTALIREGTGDRIWPVLDIVDGSYPVVNGIAEFEIEDIQGQNYRVRRLAT